MYLKALEIQGFKSFPDKTVLNFGEDMTAIVGPNGSGKSNVSDAIRWVMGEQSSKSLRGAKMEDVIFGGTEKRSQMGFAQVTLVLDNTEHIFPNMDETEVAVTRRYYRSGESEYYINKQSVRLRDINELFMDTGMGRDGYAIIGQGRIDEILSAKSTDRREIFEEAAGISKFRHRKEETERKLERTEENLVRINDKISELELQVEPLRKQSQTAKQYLLFRGELRGLEISVWLESLERIRSSKVKLETAYWEAVRQREEAKAAQSMAFAAAEQYAAQMRETDMQMERLRLEVQERQNAAAQLESEIAVLRRDIQHNQELAQRLKRELEQQEGQESSLQEQIEQRRRRMQKLQVQLDEQYKVQEAVQQQVQDELHSANVLEQELELLRQREQSGGSDAAQAASMLAALEAAAQEIGQREEQLRQELQQSK
ncbi:MAG: AAA family ATPase, partial [Oscillospiraceae bacterium]|nr:AAA family ATPase [Oscillospiraceae bacterium]